MKSLYLLPFLLVAIYSCNTKPNLKTPEKFVDGLISSINSQDSAKFNALYMNEADIDILIKTSKSTDLISKLQSEKKIILDVIRQSRTESFAAVKEKITAIQTWELSPYEIESENGTERIQNLEFEIETPDGHKKLLVIRELLKIGNQWKATSYINAEELFAQ